MEIDSIARARAEIANIKAQIEKKREALGELVLLTEGLGPSAKPYARLKAELETTKEDFYNLRGRLRKSEEELKKLCGAWAKEIVGSYPNQIEDSLKLFVEQLDTAAAGLFSSNGFAGPSVLAQFLQMRETCARGNDLKREYQLAHEILGEACPPIKAPPPVQELGNFESFLGRLIKYPAPCLTRVGDGPVEIRLWTAGFLGDLVADFIDQPGLELRYSELQRITDLMAGRDPKETEARELFRGAEEKRRKAARKKGEITTQADLVNAFRPSESKQ